MFLLSAQNSFYIMLSSYVEGHVQKNWSLNFLRQWFAGLQNLDDFFENFLQS